MGSLKSLCRTSYRSSIEIIALNCLNFQKIAVLHAFLRQTDGRKDGQVRRVKPQARYCERQLTNNANLTYSFRPNRQQIIQIDLGVLKVCAIKKWLCFFGPLCRLISTTSYCCTRFPATVRTYWRPGTRTALSTRCTLTTKTSMSSVI